MINLKCPKCGQYMSVSESLAGHDETCPNCGNVNVIPSVGPAVSAPAPALGPVANVPPPRAVDAEKQAHSWAMWCHLAGLAWLAGIPFAGVIAPLVIWQIKKDEHPFIDSQGKEALNFQISMAIYAAVSAVLAFVVVGVFLLIALFVVQLVCVITAAMRANEGLGYTYPVTIRFIK